MGKTRKEWYFIHSKVMAVFWGLPFPVTEQQLPGIDMFERLLSLMNVEKGKDCTEVWIPHERWDLQSVKAWATISIRLSSDITCNQA
mmetsp:Transcript_91059/g.262525  ORF Transcript_91059/g.262525 Transcript_91059/m.262525 type:complete len:87 (+) Transcript_91059:527-787(+)